MHMHAHVAKTTIVTDSVARMAVLVVVKSAITEMTAETTEMKLDVVCYSRYYVKCIQADALQLNFAAATTSAFRLTAHVTENQTVWIAATKIIATVSDVCVHFIRNKYMLPVDLLFLHRHHRCHYW